MVKNKKTRDPQIRPQIDTLQNYVCIYLVKEVSELHGS